MKKLILTLAIVFIAFTIIAQPPQAFKYQSVVTDNSGNTLSNQTVSFRISIRAGSPGGTVVYTETHISTTNLFGVVDLNIGEGTPTIGTFSLIDWSDGSKYMEMELDPTGGTSYVSMGISQMLSVPYALYAENVTSAVSEINDLSDARADTTSVFLGLGAGENDDGDNYNTVLGINALNQNTDRSGLVAVGDFALRNNGLGATGYTEAANNTALGSKSLYSNTTGYQNTASGTKSMFSNTSGTWNTASGVWSLYSNTTGSFNTANGMASLYSNTTGSFNTASGMTSLYSNTTGDNNTASGSRSLYANTTGSRNTASGFQALASNTTGLSNTAVGVNALYKTEDRSNLVAVGDSALYNNGLGATGSYQAAYNTALGSKSLYSNTTGWRNMAIGFQSLYSNTTGYDNTASGTHSLYSNLGGGGNTASGYRSLYHNTDGNLNTASGYQSIYYNTDGNLNTASGHMSLMLNTTGHFNTAVGGHSLYSNTTGFSNTAVGIRALFQTEDRSNLVAVGDSALYNNGLGATYYYHATRNTALGSKSMYSNTTGYDNTASGMWSLYSNTTGFENTAYGLSSLYHNTIGEWNTAIGAKSLGINTTGQYNTAAGNESLWANETGNNRTALGYRANWLGYDYSNNTGLGSYASCTASNQVRIGSSSVSSIGGYENWTNVSDLRFKDNISEDVEGLLFIQKLRPVTYNLDLHAIDDFFAEHYNVRDSSDYDGKYDKENIRHTGFIAQEVEEAALSLGYDFSGVDKPKNEDDFYGLRYAEFVVPLVKGMQEQQGMIEEQLEMNKEQQAMIETQKAMNKKQQAVIEELKSRIEELERRK